MKAGSGSAWVMFMPPLPAIRNLRPTDGIASHTSTRTPCRLSTSAAIRPAGPPPMTATERSADLDREYSGRKITVAAIAHDEHDGGILYLFGNAQRHRQRAAGRDAAEDALFARQAA